MKNVEKILRYTLAGWLIVQAGDVFFRFMERPEPSWDAQNFLISLTAAGYVWPTVGLVFLISGILLLTKRLIGLALVLLAPVTGNIALFTIFLDPKLDYGWSGVILCALHLAVAGFNWRRFRSLVRP